MCTTQANVFLRVAALVPRVKIAHVARHPLPGGVTRVEVRVVNDGYLGTYGVPSAKKLDFNEPLYAKAKALDGCELVDGAYQVLGHLDGWGHGLHTGQNLPAYPGTRGNTNAGFASYLVRGTGALDLRIGSCRAGFLDVRVAL